MSEAVVPHSFSEAASVLAGAAAQGRPVRVVGGGTKLGWGAAGPPRALELHTSHLSRVLVHRDMLCATVNAGTPLTRAQAMFAREGLMLAIDPQLGLGRNPAATVGGVVATGDGGPLSHGHGPPRDQIVGITAALSDGTVLRSGPRSDQVQEGLDPGRLFAGSFGTLGVILAVDVRLRALPVHTATALGAAADAQLLGAAARLIARAHPRLEAFDVAWRSGRGGLLAQVTADTPERAHMRAEEVAATMRDCALESVAVREDDAGLWARQRAGQRSGERALLRVHHRPNELADVLRICDTAIATAVGRAVGGVSYLTLDPDRVPAVRAALAPGTPAVLLDLPVTARRTLDPWNVPDGPELELMRELKGRFDPHGICNPGVFVGSI